MHVRAGVGVAHGRVRVAIPYQNPI